MFLRACQTELNRWNRKTHQKFYFIFPLNSVYESLNRTQQFKILGTIIKTRSFTYVKKNFDFNHPLMMLRADEELGRDFTRFTYLIIEQYGREQYSAFRLAEEKVELLRALINYDLSYNQFTQQIGRPSPLCKVEPSKFMFVFG